MNSIVERCVAKKNTYASEISDTYSNRATVLLNSLYILLELIRTLRIIRSLAGPAVPLSLRPREYSSGRRRDPKSIPPTILTFSSAFPNVNSPATVSKRIPSRRDYYLLYAGIYTDSHWKRHRLL